MADKKPNESFEDISNYVGRRRVPRRPISCRIGLLIRGQYYMASAYEIGEGGMMIDSPVPLEDKQLVVISVRVAQVLKGVMLSRVMYTLPGTEAGLPVRYGMQFEQIDFEIKRMIRNFVASNSSEVGDTMQDHARIGVAE